MATLNVHINVNKYQLIVQKEEEKAKQISQLQKKEFPHGPINFYENRFERINYSNSKINEVIGWILIIMVVMMILVMGVSVIQDSEIGFALPLLAVVSFFIVYLNWVSMKFFVNS